MLHSKTLYSKATRDALGVVFLEPLFNSVHRGENLDVIGVADLKPGGRRLDTSG
jgi:hypothetical protein